MELTNNKSIEDKNLLFFLKKESERCNDPNLHDGSYELVSKTVDLLSNLDSQEYDVEDMDMLFLMTLIISTCGWECKKKRINNSNLNDEDKNILIQLLARIKDKAEHGDYNNSHDNGSIGMFGAGFMTFKGKLSRENAQKFLKLCVDIKDITNLNEIFEKVEDVLKDGIPGFGVATVSQILHCLHPFIFPILNGAMGNETGVYDILGINLQKPLYDTNYIENTRIINKARDEKFSFVKNFRGFDLLNFLINNNENGTTLTEGGLTINKKGINKIYYGAPGTGKSYEVSNEFPTYNRITFHPEFTYFDFVGGLKPIVNENDKNDISYDFVPGPFAEVLAKAYKYPKKDVGLIIEELNRANTAAVFGDIFQLLDRDKNGQSEYSINNADLVKFIKKELNLNIPDINGNKLSTGELQHLINENNDLKDIYKELRDKILEWDNNIVIGTTSSYISFSLSKIFVRIIFTNENLAITTIFNKGKNIIDPKGITLPRQDSKISSNLTDSYPDEIFRFDLKYGDSVDYALFLIKQAYEDQLANSELKNESDLNEKSINDKNLEISNNLNEKLINGLNEGKISIPSNLSIIATMNSADQGVYVMDSAFKRRWEFKYIPIEFEPKHYDMKIAGFEVKWGTFCERLNDFLAELDINEDKHIGPYFLTEEELNDKDKFSSKLIIYLWDDVVRYKRDKLFKHKEQFSKVIKAFNEGNQIFTDSFQKKLNEKLDYVEIQD